MRKILTGALFLLAVGLATGAGDAWNDKKPEDWTAKEAKKVLENSPWAQNTSSPATWVLMDTIYRRVPQGAPSVTDDIPNGHFVVRWASSRAIRLATARQAILQGKAVPEAMEMADERRDEYEVVVVWDRLLRHPPVDERTAARSATLRARSSAVEIQATRVAFRVGAGMSTKLDEAAFFFPKTAGPDEEPWLNNAETAIDFYWQIGPGAIRARFQPEKMTLRGKRDL